MEILFLNGHLCFDCDNCYADKCPKVSDGVKRSLKKYPFISEGVQVYDANGDTKYLFVSKCDNFEKDRERHKLTTQEEIENLKRMKESIKVAYFNALDIDEADETHYDLLKRKQIVYGAYSGSFRRK